MTTGADGYQTRAAVFAIVLAVAALSLGDAVIKAMGVALPLWQMYILRSLLMAHLRYILRRERD
ncbi:MAG: hypothetical protein ACSHWY_02235 [Octadecabacter sp.]